MATINVKLPDGNTVSEKIPDGMSSSDVIAMLKKKYGKPKKELGLEGVYEDVKEGISKVPGALAESIPSLVSGSVEGAAQAFTDPVRALKNLGLGAYEGGAALQNIPLNIARYLKEKGLAPQGLVEGIEPYSMPEERLKELRENFIGGEQRGDDMLRGIGGFGPFGLMGGAKKGLMGALKRAGAAGAYATGKGENPVTASLSGALGEALTKVAQRATKPGTYLPESPLSDTELRGAARQAEGTPAGLGSVIENPMAQKILENYLPDVPFSGADKSMQTTAKILKGRGEQFLETLGRDQPKGKLTAVLRDALGEAKNEVYDIYQGKFNSVNKEAKAQNVGTYRPNLKNKSKSWLKDIQSDPDLAVTAGADVISDLKKYAKVESKKGIPQKYDLKKSDFLRSELGEASHDAYIAGNSRKSKIYAELKDAVKKDINEAIDKSGSKKLKGLRDDAMDYYENEWTPFDEKEITKFTKKGGDPDTFLTTFIKNDRLADRSFLLEKVTDKLKPETKDLFSKAYFDNAIQEGTFNPTKFSTLVKNLGPDQKKAMLGHNPQMLENIKDYADFVGKNKEAFNLMFNPKTGVRAKVLPGLMAYRAITGLMEGDPYKAALQPAALSTLGILGTKSLTSEALRNKIVNSIIKAREKNRLRPEPRNLAPFIQQLLQVAPKE